MAVKAQYGPANAFSLPFSPDSESSWPSSANTQHSNMLFPGKHNPHNNALSPADVASPLSAAGPSPSSEAGTIFTDVDSDVEVNEQQPSRMAQHGDMSVSSPDTPLSAGSASMSGPAKLAGLKLETKKTSPPQRNELEEEELPQSVIHVPSGFASFVGTQGTQKGGDQVNFNDEPERRTNRRPPSQLSEASSVSTAKPDPDDDSEAQTPRFPPEIGVQAEQETPNANAQDADKFYDSQLPTPLQTSLLPMRGEWTKTPRAQTRQDLAAFGRPASGLARIVEGEDHDASYSSNSGEDDDDDNDSFTQARSFFRNADDEIYELRTALAECWTLCNTLANMSYNHRERIFTGHSSTGNMQGQAWRSCWKLCQNLYESGSEHATISTRPTLDLCRDFCQTLFEVRVRDNEAADSVLRVSFELNNHLFNTHDRTLPETFRERTLDFYITLCHRLMKQKSRMAEETDSLLGACWGLAEMLFSLRQNKREGKKPDEELLGSAIQSCWDLCDHFREGWSQIRPDRGTPRPSQTTFTQAFNQARKSGYLDDQMNDRFEPETPTTIFEDIAAVSPYEAPVPNIMVLRSEHIERPRSSLSTASAPSNMVRPNITQRVSRPNRLNSMGSMVFGSEDARSTSSKGSSRGRSMGSNNTVRNEAEDRTMTLMKALFVRAAVQCNRGFGSDSANAPNGGINQTSLPLFVKSLPDTAFGTQAWQKDLLEKYRSTVSHDATFKDISSLNTANGVGMDPAKGRQEIAMAVKQMVAATNGWIWLRDLFRYAYGAYVEEILSIGAMPSKNGALAAHKKANSLHNAGGFRRLSAED